MLEFREDLEYYWVDGPGYPVTGAQSCGLLKDLLMAFRSKKRGTFYFSHSGALLKFLTYLGLYKDQHDLRSDNFEEMRHNRLWRTSKIGPFAGNVVFVLMDCDDQSLLSCNGGDYGEAVLLYVNEELTAIPGCGKDGWGKDRCTLEKLEELFSGPCDFETICNIGQEDTGDGEVPDDKY